MGGGLDKEETLALRESLNEHIKSNNAHTTPIEIFAGSDLNDIVDQGFYWFGEGSSATISNRPLTSAVAAVLRVERRSPGQCAQFYTALGLVNHWSAYRVRANQDWTPWKGYVIEGTDVTFDIKVKEAESVLQVSSGSLTFIGTDTNNTTILRAHHSDANIPFLRVFGRTSGMTVALGARGRTVIGAGEGMDNFLNEIEDLTSSQGTEDTFIMADSNIRFLSNTNAWGNQRTTTYSTSGNWTFPAAITATAFTQSSTQEDKVNIQLVNNALEILDKITIYKYNRQSQLEQDKSRDDKVSQIGLLLEEAPLEIISADKDGIDLYSLISVLTQVVKEQQEQINNIEEKIK